MRSGADIEAKSQSQIPNPIGSAEDELATRPSCVSRQAWSSTCILRDLETLIQEGTMRKLKLWSGACAALAIAFATVVAAQSSPSPQSNMSPKNVTVTGCVQRATEAPTATAGTTGTTPNPAETKFLLP